MIIKMDRTVGPIASALVHVLIVFLAYKFIRFVTDPPDSKIQVQVMEVETVDLEEFKQELEQLNELEHTETEMFTETPDIEEAPDVEDVSEEAVDDLSSLDINNSFDSPVVMSGLFAGRTESGRQRMLGRYGGKYGAATERAVLAALEWLKKNQKPDGSWASSRPAGIAGLGLLTFLAHGETPSSDKYGATVEKAMKYLLSKQDAQGRFDKTGHMYSHAIASYAISEAYALTRIPALKPAMEKGTAVIVDGLQTRSVPKQGTRIPVPGLDGVNASKVTAGLWDYNYKKSDRWDLSYAGWQVQALKAAKLAGSTNPKLDVSLQIASNGIKYFQNEGTGKFGYSKPGSGGPAMTSVGTLCLQLLGHGKSTEVKKGLTALENAVCDWNKPRTGHGLYDWYYLTQAKFHSGENPFKKWNLQFAPQFIKNQQKDGHWKGPPSQGGAKEDAYGPAYTTTLSALTLMVYYRNLPTFQEKAVKSSPAKQLEANDDVEVEVI